MKSKKIILAVITTLLIFNLTGCASLLYRLASQTSDGDSLMMEGIEAYNDGNYAEAIKNLEQAEEKGLDKQEISVLHSYLGMCYSDMGMTEIAIEYQEKALEEDPSDVQNYVGLAISYRLLGDYDKAMDYYMQGMEVDPDDPELNSSIGTLYIILDEPQTAIPFFEKALEENPDLAVTYGNAALAYAMTGDFKTAEEYLQISREKGYPNADIIQQRIDELKIL